jgi:hypothetical protein
MKIKTADLTIRKKYLEKEAGAKIQATLPGKKDVNAQEIMDPSRLPIN